MPRRVIFDLLQTSEISEKGLGTLLNLCQADGIEGRAAVMIDGDRASLFGDLILIIPDEPDAWQALGIIPSAAGGPMKTRVQRAKDL